MINPVFEWLYSRLPRPWRFPESRGLLIRGSEMKWKTKGIDPHQDYTIGAHK